MAASLDSGKAYRCGAGVRRLKTLYNLRES
jgi:hypothetical protein